MACGPRAPALGLIRHHAVQAHDVRVLHLRERAELIPQQAFDAHALVVGDEAMTKLIFLAASLAPPSVTSYTAPKDPRPISRLHCNCVDATTHASAKGGGGGAAGPGGGGGGGAGAGARAGAGAGLGGLGGSGILARTRGASASATPDAVALSSNVYSAPGVRPSTRHDVAPASGRTVPLTSLPTM